MAATPGVAGAFELLLLGEVEALFLGAELAVLFPDWFCR